MHRTHTCGQLTINDINTEVTLCGRVDTVRNLGGMTFIALRDRYGITQIKLDPAQCQKSLHEIADGLKAEYVVKITGFVIRRPDGMANKNMITGEIELQPTNIVVLSTSDELPFTINHDNNAAEETRLEYRYLDLRREQMKNTMQARHSLTMAIMNFFDQENFLYIETPTFIKNTPEGAREYVVPVRSEPGKFYVLPQSPQQLKQLSMVAGADKYFQLARCYRDEPLRGDRQPEFTQIDCEMSFIQQEDVLQLQEKFFNFVTDYYNINAEKKGYGQKKSLTFSPFVHMTRDEAMNTYGIDKPELRTQELKLIECTEIAHSTEATFLQQAPNVKAIIVPKVYGRSEIDNKLTPLAQQKGAKGLAYLTIENGEIKGSVAKFFTKEHVEKLLDKVPLKEGETRLGREGEQTIFFQASDRKSNCDVLGFMRNHFIKDLNLLEGKENELAFAFVTDFPLYEIDEETRELAPAHQPFTKPKDADIPFVIQVGEKILAGGKLSDEEKDKMISLRADCYDVVLNGYELGSGSIRITDPHLQKIIFAILGLTEEQISERFGHILKAFKYGVPPHGGFALGFDRIIMIYQNMPNIREVIAYPKNGKGEDLMLSAPSFIEESTLKELGLKIVG